MKRTSGRILVLLSAALAGLAASAGASAPPPAQPPVGASLAGQTPDGATVAASIRAAIAAQERHTPALLARPGVVGTGVGIGQGGEAFVVVYTTSSAVSGLPSRLDGVPVRTEATGVFVARTDTTARLPRPVPIGVSTGHPDITAGTIGARVKDGSGNIYALSNNHVYADENDASLGDGALQPGPHDGGEDPEDRIGELADFEPIDFSGGENMIDAAIARSSTDLLGNATPSDDGYGTPSSAVFGDGDADGFIDSTADLLNLAVKKFGRTTKLTEGTVAEINVTVEVCYDARGVACFKSALFVDQIAISPGSFSAGGDSGSLVVTRSESNNPVGLLFAGSSTRTLANRIDLVLDRFGVTVDDVEAAETPVTDLAVSSVQAPGSVTQGDLVDVTVTVENVGNQEVTADVNVTLTDETDGAAIGTLTIVGGLAAGASTTLAFTWDTQAASLGDHVLRATHDLTDDEPANDAASATVRVVEESASLHVGDLDGSAVNRGRVWDAVVTITVHDGNHDPVADAAVSGTWSAGASGSSACTTGSDGRCSVAKGSISKRTGSVVFTVDNVGHGSLAYEATLNHDPDEDSDGTSITVSKP